MTQRQQSRAAKRPSKAPDQTRQQTDTAVKVAFYALVGTLGTAFSSAVAQIVVAWFQRQ